MFLLINLTYGLFSIIGHTWTCKICKWWVAILILQWCFGNLNLLGINHLLKLLQCLNKFFTDEMYLNSDNSDESK